VHSYGQINSVALVRALSVDVVNLQRRRGISKKTKILYFLDFPVGACGRRCHIGILVVGGTIKFCIVVASIPVKEEFCEPLGER